MDISDSRYITLKLCVEKKCMFITIPLRNIGDYVDMLLGCYS